MKLIILIAVIFVSFYNGFSQESITIHDEIFEELKNEHKYSQKHNLKNFTEYLFKDASKKDSILVKKTEYNEVNNITKKVVFLAFTNPKDSTVTTYLYDTLNQINEILTVYSEHSYISMYKFRFENSGSRLELFYDFGYKNKLELEKYIYSFHDDGRIDGKQFNQEIFSNVYYIYNPKNLLINISYVKNDTNQNILYDDKGNILLIKRDNGSKTVFKYDDKGSIIEDYFQDEYGKLKSHLKRTYTYDVNNNPIEIKVFTGSGKLQYSNTIEYNNENLPISLVSYDKKGKVNHTFKYYYTYY